MKNSKIAFLFITVIYFIISCTSNNRTKDKWVLVWEENFDQVTGLDTTVWSKIPRGTSDWNNYMSDSEDCYDIQNGNLILRGIISAHLSNDTARYQTGGVWTKDKKTFSNGRIEIKAKLGEATGAWPAIWMLAQDKKWPDGGEIDIMEHLNFDSIVYQTIHTHYTYVLGMEEPPKGGINNLKRNDYNIYALEMYPDSLAFFVNDSLTFVYPRIETDKEGQFPFDQPFYLLIDMQLGGSWVGGVNADELPVEMQIDWVKFYQKQPE